MKCFYGSLCYIHFDQPGHKNIQLVLGHSWHYIVISGTLITLTNAVHQHTLMSYKFMVPAVQGSNFCAHPTLNSIL